MPFLPSGLTKPDNDILLQDGAVEPSLPALDRISGSASGAPTAFGSHLWNASSWVECEFLYSFLLLLLGLSVERDLSRFFLYLEHLAHSRNAGGV